MDIFREAPKERFSGRDYNQYAYTYYYISVMCVATTGPRVVVNNIDWPLRLTTDDVPKNYIIAETDDRRNDFWTEIYL